LDITLSIQQATLFTPYVRRIADHNTAATIKTITKVSGTAVLLSVLSTIFNINPARARDK
jgi:hypothetical protein